MKPDKSGYAPINDLKMYYEIYGTGFPLVLIHGGGSTIPSNWSVFIPILSKSHQVIAVEMQAHGRTKDIDRPLSFEHDADDIAGLLKHLRIPKANILGFSNGGTTTLQVAIRHPHIVNKIIVCSAGYKKLGFPPGFTEMFATMELSHMLPILKEEFLKVNPDQKEFEASFWRDVNRMKSFPEWSDEETRKIKASAMIVIGAQDIVSPEHALEMSQLIENSILYILPGGHGGYLGEVSVGPAPDDLVSTFSSMVNSFLESK